MGRQINLTDSSTGATVSMNTMQIVGIVASGSGSKVTYTKEIEKGAGQYQITVDESPAAILTLSVGDLFTVTSVAAGSNINAAVTYDNLVGTFTVGEIVVINNITRGLITADTGSILSLSNIQNGAISNNNTIRGLTSGATALVNVTVTYTYSSGTNTQYVNALRVRQVVANAEGALNIISYDASGVIDIPIYVTDSISTINTAVNGSDGDTTLAGNNAFTGNNTMSGTLVQSNTTDSTSSTTGAFKTAGGVGIAKALFVGTTINAGTAITVGTDITGAKEVDHIVTVATTTTAATVGGKITVKGATGATSGNGGAAEVVGGVGGATAGSTGGAVNITSGASGAGGGPSGAIPIATAAGTVTGAISITTGAGTTNSGNINITPGTSASATVASAVILDNGVVRKPFSTSVASGGTVTGPQLLKGLITVTGATGNIQLPTAAQITTALGATPTGTSIEFFVNAAGMTATNIATLLVGTNMTVMSAPAITGGGSLAVTQDTQVVGKFLLIYDSATTCKISRIA